jgi:hypothetical protein
MNVISVDFFTKIMIIPLSILIGLLATYVTPPETNKTLTKFYNQINPDGFWNFDNKKSSHNLKSITAPLISSIFLALSILLMIFGLIQFATGNVTLAIVFLVLGCLILIKLVKRINLL